MSTNKKPGTERMWNSRNRVLFTNSELRATITNHEKLEELSIFARAKASNYTSTLVPDLSVFDIRHIKSNHPSKITWNNFNYGFASMYFNKIVQHNDLHEPR